MSTDDNDSFWTAVRHGALPLLVWAAHFFFAYVAIAATCRAGWPAAGITLLLLGTSAAALAVLTALLFIHWPRRRAPPESLAVLVPPGAALLSLIGVAWSSVPMLWLVPC